MDSMHDTQSKKNESFSIFAFTFGGLARSIWDATEKARRMNGVYRLPQRKNWYKIQEIYETLSEKLEMLYNLRKRIDQFFLPFPKRRILYEYINVTVLYICEEFPLLLYKWHCSILLFLCLR